MLGWSSLFIVGTLVIAGVVTIVAPNGRVLLIGLAVHTITLALLASGPAGPIMTGAVFVGNATAVAVMGLALFYLENGKQEAPVATDSVPSHPRGQRRRALDKPRGSSGFLNGLSAILAVVIAWGLSNKPIAGLAEATAGLPSLVAYWLLTAGLVILLANREYLKVGAGLLLMVNGSQIVYLMSATSLEARLIAASVVVVLAVSLGVSHLAVVAAKLSASQESLPTPEVSANSAGDACSTVVIEGDKAC